MGEMSKYTGIIMNADDLRILMQDICNKIDALNATSIGDLSDALALDNLAAIANRGRRLSDTVHRELIYNGKNE